MSTKLLSRAEILQALERLAAELPSASPVEIVVGGGAALVLLYNAREATKDVDALALISVEPAVVRSAAGRVAEQMGLPEDWLNEGAKGYLHGLVPGKVLFERFPLTVRAVAPQQLLAMKLSAWRDDVDIADARLLLSKLTGNIDQVWSLTEPHVVPGRELKARYAFDDLWELDRGRP
ncbi:MAG TPA: hypothetical protein VGH73_02675 [Thermoanaerobaculia bacterium]